MVNENHKLLFKVGQEIPIKTPFKGDNVNASIKCQISKNVGLYFSKKIQKISPFVLVFLGFNK